MTVALLLGGSRPGPAGVEVVRTDRDGWEAVRRCAAHARWIWILRDAHATDRAPLDALLAHAHDDVPLLVGTVRDPGGAPVRALLPRSPEDDPARVIAAVTRRTLPLRWAPLAHALVRGDVVARAGVPDAARYGEHAAAVWTARLLRAAPGLHVPGSAVAASDPGARGGRAAAVRTGVALMRSGALTRVEGGRLALAELRGAGG